MPGDVVGVLGALEPDLPLSWMAVLARGATFLPLSPDEPPARIRSALERTGARVLLALAEPPHEAVPDDCKLVLSEQAPADAAPLDPVTPRANAPAYILRTSGSSGEPKLVVITRASLNNYLRWCAEELFDGGAVMPAVSSPVFDASLKQLLAPLRSAETVWLLTAERTDVTAVREELRSSDRPVDLNCIPTYWSELLRDEEQAGAPPIPLRRLLLGGEPVGEQLVRATAERYPRVAIHNLYGPTEATATTTMGTLTVGDPVTVGTPIAGARVYVVDRGNACLPANVHGQVAIAGPGLANGYLGEDDDAFAALRTEEGPVRAYLTGDRGWLDDDGRLRLLGRDDDQIKLRGWRIELGEVRAQVETVPGVSNAVVLVDDGGEEPVLRAFVVGDVESDEVSRQLRAHLPGPMMPASVHRVEQVPTTVTGKVDGRELLRRLEVSDDEEPDDYSESQRIVASAWREVLGSGWPRPEDDFFASGGHSLALARLVNRLRAAGHTQLSLRAVLRQPTLETIAQALGDD